MKFIGDFFIGENHGYSLKHNYEQRQLDNFLNWLEAQKVKVSLVKGEQSTILGLVGDTLSIDTDMIKAIEIVESVKRIQEPYKAANRKFHPDDTIIEVAGRRLSSAAGF